MLSTRTALRDPATRAEIEATIKSISVNHFDADAFFSAWSLLNPDLALRYAAVLTHAARIGDFREIPPPGSYDSPADLPKLLGALKVPTRSDSGAGPESDLWRGLAVACWLSSEECTRFSRPYETKDLDQKFRYFMPRFEAVLADPLRFRHEWGAEYDRVLSELAVLAKPGRAEVVPALGLGIVRIPVPAHYYSIYSASSGCDYCLSIYRCVDGCGGVLACI